MANSKLIVVEGAQGAGKTTYTDYIRHSLSYTNLYRLCGTSDNTKTGLEKATNMYENLLDYIKNLENSNVNLLFDRTFFSEEVYCRLGKKEYSFTKEYSKLLEKFSKLDFDIYYINLYLEDEKIFEERLNKSNRAGKAKYKASEFDAKNSISQQKEYFKIADEIKEKYPNIHIVKIQTDREDEIIKKEIREKIGY